MTVTAQQFREWLSEFGLTGEQLADAIGRPVADVVAWSCDVDRRIPPYIRLTMVAIRAKLSPFPTNKCEAAALGIERSRVNFWKTTGEAPLSARLAMAGDAYERITNKAPTSRDKEILRTVEAGNFYRVAGGWRTLHGPKYRAATVSPFIGRGLVRVDGHYLRLTPQGRKMLA